MNDQMDRIVGCGLFMILVSISILISVLAYRIAVDGIPHAFR